MQNFFVVTHRWVALITSVFIIVLGISGAALIYETELDQALNPALYRVPAGGPVSLDTLVSRVRVAFPSVELTSVQLPSRPGLAAVFQARRVGEIFVDPSSGRILGSRTPARRRTALAPWLHSLHTKFLAGQPGRIIVQLGTLSALYLAITGIVLWWPEKIIRVQWNASWKRINFDLHHVTGILTSVIVLLMTGTGLLMTAPSINLRIARAIGFDNGAGLAQPAGMPGTPEIGLDRAVALAVAALPGAQPSSISLPSRPDQPLRISLRLVDDTDPEDGSSFVVIDRYSGATLAKSSSHEAPLGNRMVMLESSLHTGRIFGAPTLILWALCSLILATQALTGFLMWWNARAGRKEA